MYITYGFSSIGSCLYAAIGEEFKNKIMLHSFIEVKFNQAYTPGTFMRYIKF